MQVVYVNPTVLQVHPRNQEFFDDLCGREYEIFEQSIREDGILQELIVSPDMTVISGHQRLKAALNIGLDKIPVHIKEELEDEDKKLKTLLAANFGRVKNSPVKQAKVISEYEKLRGIRNGSGGRASAVSDPNYSGRKYKQEDIAQEFGVTVDTIRNLKNLLKLCPEFQQLIEDGTMSATTGFKLVAKLSEEDQEQLFAMLPVGKKITSKIAQQYIDQISKWERDEAVASKMIDELDLKLRGVLEENERIKRGAGTDSEQQLMERISELQDVARVASREADTAKRNCERIEKISNQRKEAFESACKERDSAEEQLVVMKEEVNRLRSEAGISHIMMDETSLPVSRTKLIHCCNIINDILDPFYSCQDPSIFEAWTDTERAEALSALSGCIMILSDLSNALRAYKIKRVS